MESLGIDTAKFWNVLSQCQTKNSCIVKLEARCFIWVEFSVVPWKGERCISLPFLLYLHPSWASKCQEASWPLDMHSPSEYPKPRDFSVRWLTVLLTPCLPCVVLVVTSSTFESVKTVLLWLVFLSIAPSQGHWKEQSKAECLWLWSSWSWEGAE